MCREDYSGKGIRHIHAGLSLCRTEVSAPVTSRLARERLTRKRLTRERAGGARWQAIIPPLTPVYPGTDYEAEAWAGRVLSLAEGTF